MSCVSARDIFHWLLFQLLSNVLLSSSVLLPFFNYANSAHGTGETEVPNAVREQQDGAGTAPCHCALWEGSRTGYVAVNWEQAFCGFSFGLDQALARILCSTSTHLQQEITLIFHLVKLFLC